MTKWWFYSYVFSTREGSGTGNGMVRVGIKPNIKRLNALARDIEEANGLPKKSVVITNYIPVTK